MGRAQKNLGGSVPEGQDLVGVLFQRNRHGATQTEIGNFQNQCLLVHEEVVGFKITVEDSTPVAEC